MTARRFILEFALTVMLSAMAARSAESLPALITTTATTTLDTGGRPWAYLAFGESRPGLLAGHRLAIYVKAGVPASAAPFAGRGFAMPTTDPTVINVLLSRAASVGDNLPALEAQMIALHRSLINVADSITQSSNEPPAMPLPQRLSALLSRAAGDSSLAQLLDLQGLAHPALRLVRGTAWAGPLDVAVGTAVTLEVRDANAAGADLAVIGRVTLSAGQPEVLPAPGPLAIVPDATSGGDLNVKLRWATSDALRNAGTRHHGDVLWRVSRAFFEAQGFNIIPLAGSTLDALSLSNPANVMRLSGPVFPSKLFTATNVTDFTADATTFYVADNNNRYAANGAAMVEGAQYYYLAAAADALGKPGTASAGVLATFCRRVPPRVPTKLAVVNQWAPATGPYLDVSWQSNAPGDSTSTTRYEVFRGNDLTQHAAAQRGELNLDANPIVSGLPDAIQRIAIIPEPGAVLGQTLHVSDAANVSSIASIAASRTVP